MYDSNRSMLSVIRHESLYAAYTLTKDPPNKNYQTAYFDNLLNLEESIDLWNNYLDCPIQIGNDPNIYSYGLCLVNKWLGFEEIKFKFTINKKKASDFSNIIHKHSLGNKDYYDRLNELNKKLLTFITISNHSPSIDFDEMINLVEPQDQDLFKKLPNNNVIIGYAVNEGLIDRCIEKANQDSDLMRLYNSGSRFDKQQLARTAINVGYTADAENVIDPQPITTNLLRGLTKDDFFLSSPGSRKGISDKAAFVPESGYLERTLTMALSPVELIEEDCQTLGFIETVVFSRKHAQSLVGKYYKIAGENFDDWQVLDEDTAISLINRKIMLRSPMTCHSPNFRVCKKCFGTREFPTKYVGIVAGQVVSERLTQLIMRLNTVSFNSNVDVKPF